MHVATETESQAYQEQDSRNNQSSLNVQSTLYYLPKQIGFWFCYVDFVLNVESCRERLIEMPPKINFVERNKQNIASKKKAVKKEVVDKDNGGSKDTEKENKPQRALKTSSAANSRPHPLSKTNSSRPASAPVKPRSDGMAWYGMVKKRRPTTESPDIVTSLVRRGMQEALLKIFMPLDNTTLTACRKVSMVYLNFIFVQSIFV